MDNRFFDKKNRGWLLTAALALVLAILITAVILFVRLSDFSNQEKEFVIDITPDDQSQSEPTQPEQTQPEQTQPEQTQPQTSEQETQSQDPTSTRPTRPAVEYLPGFEARDTQQVWTTDTHVDIFRISYENGEHQITVLSEDTDKLVAPGTSNEYTFWLKNTGNVPLEYEVWTEAYFSHEGNTIPVSVKLGNYNGRYYVGSETTWEEVDQLNSFRNRGYLSVNSYDSYTLQWQWPFESGDDVYDTMLGNLAVDEDITLTVEIHTKAVADIDATGGLPATGDEMPVQLLVWLLVISGGMLLLLISMKKQGDRNEKQA